MDKQIEEMAKCLDGCPYLCEGIGGNKHNGDLKIAEYLYNAGYCKIPEWAVVLTREEWEHRAYLNAMQNDLCKKCQKEIGEKLVSKDECEYWKSRVKEIGDIAYEQARTETAEKFAKRFKAHLKQSYHNLYHSEYREGMVSINLDTLIENIDEICKELVDEKIKALESDNDDKTINS